MGAQTFVDVKYRGLELGRRHGLGEVGPTTAYLEHPTPMPVGTRLDLEADGGVQLVVEVVRVHEQVAGVERAPGMRVRATAPDERAASLWRSLVSTGDPAPETYAVDPEEPVAAQAEEPAAAEAARPTEQMSVVEVEAILATAEPEATDPAGEVGGGEAGGDGGKGKGKKRGGKKRRVP